MPTHRPPQIRGGEPPPSSASPPDTTAHLAISGSDHLMHLSVFFIMEEFCIRKKGRRSRRTRTGWKRPGPGTLRTATAGWQTARRPRGPTLCTRTATAPRSAGSQRARP